MRNIGLKACALCIALVFVGASRLSEAGLYDINDETLILRLSVDQLRVCLKPNNPGYLETPGPYNVFGYPGSLGYKGPDSVGLDQKLDPFKGPYSSEHVQAVLEALEKKEAKERAVEYFAYVKLIDKHTNKAFYAVDHKKAVLLRKLIDEDFLPGMRLEIEAAGVHITEWRVANARGREFSEQEEIDNEKGRALRLLSQIFRIFAHNCKTQGF